MKIKTVVVFVTFLFVLTGLVCAGTEEKFGIGQEKYTLEEIYMKYFKEGQS